jgi:hypothetical protein
MRWNAESNARYYTQIRYRVQLVRDCTAPQMAREYEQASRIRWCQTISLTKLDTILSIPAEPGRAALERHQSVKSCNF